MSFKSRCCNADLYFNHATGDHCCSICTDPVKVKTGYLKKDRQERYNSKRAWFVNAWRIVDKNGADIIQPWSNTKKEAYETAAACFIEISGILD